MITVALADDHATTRKGIRTILELNADIRVVAEASSGTELLEILGNGTVPAVVLLDINMPGMNGYALTKSLRAKYPSVSVVAFSMLTGEDAIINMIRSGACGFISKSSDPSLLAGAVISVHTHGFYLGGLARKEHFSQPAKHAKRGGFNGKYRITPKEVRFIELCATDLNYKEIGEQMNVQPKTVENYRDSLFEKLDIRNRAALVLYAVKNGIIDIR